MKQLLAICLCLLPWISWAQQTLVVDAYEPAPGQFVNTLPAYEPGDTPERMAEKCTEALNEGGMVTLGAWGGSITFHLSHPVVNLEGQRDLYLKGNAYAGNSEPGIVQVAVDANGNGLPDDPWYEIAGSADVDSLEAQMPDAEGWARMQFGYRLTYVHPDTLADVPWTDAQGNSGQVMRNAYHTQDYYPLWMPDTLTCEGTLLPPNATDRSGQGFYWELAALRYGYVDNVANSDTLGCSVDLSWAVDPLTRQHVQLTHADFIRVYSGQRQQCGWIGETSTELAGAMDLHPEASIDFEMGIGQPVEDKEKAGTMGSLFLPEGFRIKAGRIVFMPAWRGTR